MGGYSEQCPKCGKWYTDRSALDQHVKSHPNPSLSRDELLQAFSDHWSRKMRQGTVSAMTVMEQHTLKYAFRWLLDHYEVSLREGIPNVSEGGTDVRHPDRSSRTNPKKKYP